MRRKLIFLPTSVYLPDEFEMTFKAVSEKEAVATYTERFPELPPEIFEKQVEIIQASLQTLAIPPKVTLSIGKDVDKREISATLKGDRETIIRHFFSELFAHCFTYQDELKQWYQIAKQTLPPRPQVKCKTDES